ncbi:hypothetical protein pEaSNUABM14_00301 [Erwinia phage pEa_SNUABM_14]|uniref:Uncharacterized protein n=1 Tax=Erwinia phage pEa_SNUABM_7 TaxID=2866695 RepID=A0AAE7WSK7_9CAUD|nr:hypothetical protein MPK74_gp304 [Erwinia phage pEa_SNUABM_7]QYW03260.1 hypothetical protein pEaSNUABM13_00301 [Erwinia phage pEa_SNUABM_13]QYW03942.1 hypothetical protein pEaSNUABM45_00299 [Erwinia phage pEa_SNUABM_45]QYW04283.1 hypothetical protein pEaSNUABM46_00299 [Erwinia phage pEa_SNUABM_46]QYW04626.1 hypothetical protein pEaSNUABM14_00301 [Erwinia phage pEa_SNUABM_14]QYW05654.1 hypothetical protein pEaSNUABM25_00298 [Erwinia phage pEa_SNUABM_25]
MARNISRKKALDLMAKTYNEKHPEYLPRLMKEDMNAKDLFEFREDVVAQIQAGLNPAKVVDDMIDNAIRVTTMRRRMSNDYNPKISDVLTDELREELRKL